jgi:hypothetical protein
MSALWLPGIAAADNWSAGGGITYQFDPTKPGLLVMAAWTPWHGRYEFAATRFVTAQTRSTQTVAAPNWVFQASRRWSWRFAPHMTAFVGLGAAYKSQNDNLNGSHLNFTEQLGCRFRIAANAPMLEIALRHISNAGIVRPNRGEDFVTLTAVF